MKLKILETKNLSKKFGSYKALHNINFTVEKGEVFGLLGTNGAGKTTLIRTLTGLIKPSSGYAQIFGLDIQKDIMKIRKRVSLLPQECDVYENLTAWENIEYYGKLYDTLSDEKISQNTDEIINLIGLKGREHELTKNYSGGMKRKVLIARSLVMEPDLIFLDEPTTAIDVLGARTVRNLIKKLSNDLGKTIILTTHDLSDISELCDRVAIMNKGEIIEIGKPNELEEKFKAANIEELFISLATGENMEVMH